MISLRSAPFRRITNQLTYLYHVLDIMNRAYIDRKTFLYPPANHLYIKKIVSSNFNEKQFCFILLEQEKMNPSPKNYEDLFEYLDKNIHEVQAFRSISTLMVVALEVKLKNLSIVKRIAERGFQIMKESENEPEEKKYGKPFRGNGYSIVRFLVGINKMIGLKSFKNEYYEMIEIEQIKPLFISFILELFWEEGISNYPFAKKLVRIFEEKEHFIPFADVHHLTLSTKKIKDEKYGYIVKRIHQKLSKTVTNNSMNGEQKEIETSMAKTLFEEYLKDIKGKYL